MIEIVNKLYNYNLKYNINKYLYYKKFRFI